MGRRVQALPRLPSLLPRSGAWYRGTPMAPIPLSPMQYRSPWNEVRLGRLLEDLDAMAGYIAFTHRCLPEQGV